MKSLLHLRHLIFFSLSVVPLISAVAFADEPPAWLKQAAAMSVPTYSKEVHAVVLHDESRKTVDNDGKIVTVSWQAIRILAREGRNQAQARESYNTGSGKIKEMRAWLIRPTGEIKSYGKKETMDLALAENDVYNETREKLISAKDDADAA